jgi:hypothetical protein
MVQELYRRVSVLEAKSTEMEKMPEVVRQLMDSYLLASKPMDQEKVAANVAAITGRSMCPHCGVKPNHFFHVRTCEKKKNNGANPDQRRDSNSP